MRTKKVLCLFLVLIMVVVGFAAAMPINATDNNGENELPPENTGPGDIPRFLKEEVIDILEDAKTGDKKTDNKLDKAIKHIEKSLDDKYWLDDTHLDPKHGKKVFDEEKKAVKELQKLMKKDMPEEVTAAFTNKKPIRLETTIECIPEVGARYSTPPEFPPTEMYDVTSGEKVGTLKSASVTFDRLADDDDGDTFSSTARITVDITGLGPMGLELTGPTVVERSDPPMGGGTIDTEIVSMDLTGSTPLGSVRVKAGQDQGLTPSKGKITPKLPGYDYPAESFFDIFFEIELPKIGGISNINNAIGKMLAADELIAGTTFKEAFIYAGLEEGIGGDEPWENEMIGGDEPWENKLEKSAKEFRKADRDITKQKYDKAIDHYAKAWEHALKALEKIKKDLSFNVKPKKGAVVGIVTIKIGTSGRSEGMEAVFEARTNLTDAAKKCGEHHFNWYQIIVSESGTTGMVNSSGNALTPPYVDPPQGGYGDDPATAGDETQWADNQPWYWDEGADPPAGTAGFSDGYNLDDNSNATHLEFSDYPGDQPGAKISFKTWLVSLNADGSLHSWHGGFSWDMEVDASGNTDISNVQTFNTPPTAAEYTNII